MKQKKKGKIRWRKQDKILLKNRIKRYNSELTKALKRNDNDITSTYFPEKINYDEQLKKIYTRKDFNKFIKSINRANKDNLKLKQYGDGIVATEYVVKETQIRVRAINLTKRHKKEKANISIYRGNTGILNKENLNKTKFNINEMNQAIFDKNVVKIQRQFITDNYEKDLLYKNNYLKAMFENLSGAENFEKLYSLVNSLPPYKVVEAFYKNPNLHIDHVYSHTEVEKLTNNLLQLWSEI